MIGPLDALQAQMARVTAILRGIGPSATLRAAFGRPIEIMRELGEQSAAAEATAQALVVLPKATLRQLTVTAVRCPSGAELLLRVVRIPPGMPGAQYDDRVVIPTSGATYRSANDRVSARAWFLGEDNTVELRCRCHPPVTVTESHLRGESPPPGDLKVLWF